MKLGLKFPERLAGPLYPVREALEDLIIGIEKGWSQEHLGTGQHNAITALSIGYPTPAETGVLALTSGIELRSGPASLSRSFRANSADPSVLTPPQITATVNDYGPAGLDQALVLRLNVDTNRTINGLRRPQPTQARLYWLVNTTTSIITLAHEAAGSTAENRFYCPGVAGYFLHAYGAVALLYDPVTLRWRVLDSSAPNIYYDNSTAFYGLGTTAPATTVTVSGDISTTSGNRFTTAAGADLRLDAPSGRSVLLQVNAVTQAQISSAGVLTVGQVGTHIFGATSGDSRINVRSNATYQIGAANAAGNAFYFGATAGASPAAVFSNNAGTERMRITDGGNIGVGATPSASSLMDLSSTTATLLIPRMTTTQKNNLTAINGMIVYDSTLDKFQGYEAGAWNNFSLL